MSVAFYQVLFKTIGFLPFFAKYSFQPSTFQLNTFFHFQKKDFPEPKHLPFPPFLLGGGGC